MPGSGLQRETDTQTAAQCDEPWGRETCSGVETLGRKESSRREPLEVEAEPPACGTPCPVNKHTPLLKAGLLVTANNSMQN